MTVSSSPGNAKSPSSKVTPNSAPASAAANGASNAVLRPKSVSQWSVLDLQKWFRRNCGDYYHLYWENFLQQDITGESPTLVSPVRRCYPTSSVINNTCKTAKAIEKCQN